MKFTELNLPEPLLRAIEDLGFEEATEIQARALPLLLKGKDVAGQAQTGTGKTACFLLAALTRLLDGVRPGSRPRVLCIAPTRELAMQIGSDAEDLSSHTDMKVALAYGGSRWKAQANAIAEGSDIVVGTPGRLIDYIKQRVLVLDKIEVLIIDEADRMFDMGFIEDLTYIFRRCPSRDKRQSLLFSATLDDRVMRLARRWMNQPERVEVNPDSMVVDEIEQSLFHVGSDEKLPLLLGLLEREQPTRSIVFINRKVVGEELAWRLNENGVQAVYMSGDLPQSKRTGIIEALKRGEIQLLVTTDVASRGLHVDDISHVFNYDLPQDPEDYVHRVGRTARAGATGRAISLACEDYVFSLEPIQKLIESEIPSEWVTDDLLGDDKSGRFRRRRGRPFTGWPPEEARSEEGPAKKKKTRKRKKKSDAPLAEAASGSETPAEQKAKRAPVKEDAPPAPEREEETSAAEESPKKARRRKRRRRIGDGPGLTSPG